MAREKANRGEIFGKSSTFSVGKDSMNKTNTSNLSKKATQKILKKKNSSMN